MTEGPINGWGKALCPFRLLEAEPSTSLPEGPCLQGPLVREVGALLRRRRLSSPSISPLPPERRRRGGEGEFRLRRYRIPAFPPPRSWGRGRLGFFLISLTFFLKPCNNYLRKITWFFSGSRALCSRSLYRFMFHFCSFFFFYSTEPIG